MEVTTFGGPSVSAAEFELDWLRWESAFLNVPPNAFSQMGAGWKDEGIFFLGSAHSYPCRTWGC